MNILIACEESQRVCIEFRKKGHNAFSCDVLSCSGDHPEWHIMSDVLPILNGNCTFTTCDGVEHSLNTRWDMIIAFPPCTHLAISGAKHFEKKREDGRQEEGILFFKNILEADCDKIAVENPVNIIGSDYISIYFPQYSYLPNCDQYIQPYEYGENARKKTCLWLKNLPKLKPTNIVKPELVEYYCSDGRKVTFSKDYGGGGGLNGQRRSKTYLGVARAMADQWG